MSAKSKAKVLEMVPSGVGRNKDSPHQLAGMIVDGQQEGLFVRGGPPLVDGGVVLPELAHSCAFPSPSGLGGRGRCVDQKRKVSTGVGRNRFTVALKTKTIRQLIGDQLVIRRSLKRQEGLQKLPYLLWPGGMMVAPGELQGEGARVLKPERAQAEEMSAADI